MTQVLPRLNRTEGEFVPPSDALISSLDGTYYKLSEAVILTGKSASTLRRLMKKNLVKAPSGMVRQGKNTYYLYTPEDIQEIRDYYTEETQVVIREAN
jgi:predicted transcriptional regulator